MKKKFYIISHNPNKIGDISTANTVVWSLAKGANALEPDIYFYDGDKHPKGFYTYDPVVTSSSISNYPTLSDYCNGLTNLLIQNPQFNLALIAWDMKNVQNSNFDFWKIRDIITDNIVTPLINAGYGEIPMLFTNADNFNYLIQWASPYLRSNWALSVDDVNKAQEVMDKLKNHGFCYTYANGKKVLWKTYYKTIKKGIALRDAGNSFSLVYAWTINNLGHWKNLLDIGVDGIITDDVAQLRALIGGNGFPDTEYTHQFELATSADNPFNCQHPVVGTPAPEPTKPDFKVKTFKFIQGEMFVAINSNGKGTLLKIKNTGATGHNMFAIKADGHGDFDALPDYEKQLLGSQVFHSYIIDIIYAENFTLVGLANGSVLKIKQTGGTGHNMFAVTETWFGFITVDTYHYYEGDAKFNSGITCLKYINGFTFVSLKDGKLLKVRGTAGSGHNLFAVTEFADHFDTVVDYDYRVGDAKFMGYVKGMEYVLGYLFIWFDNGKMLKINGLGGSGYNMFAVIETATEFTNVNTSLYNYYIGDALFGSAVQCVNFVSGFLFMGFVNGKILKINGAGGSGHNLFAVVESIDKFTNYDPSIYNYYSGDSFFHSFIITDIKYYNGYLMISMANDTQGAVLKILNVGGTKHNMFNIIQSGNSFSSGWGVNYLKGDGSFNTGVTGFDLIEGNLFTAFSNGLLLDVKNTGGTGHNLFAVIEHPASFENVPGYNYYIGEQFFV